MSDQQVSGPLTDEQIKFFREQGYVVVPELFSKSEIGPVTQWVEEVEAWPETAGKWMMYFEQTEDKQRLLNRIENMLPYHKRFNALAAGEKMQGACGQLFGEPATLFKDKINFKKPGGGGFESHQDVQEWTPLDDANMGELKYEKIEAEPGDAVFFDSYAPHRSEPNRSNSPRRVLYYTYNAASAGDHIAQYYADKRLSYPPDIERDDDKEYVYRV
jgi:hypothetical protein